MSDQLSERRRQLAADPKNVVALLQLVQELRKLGRDAEAYVSLFRHGQLTIEDDFVGPLVSVLNSVQAPYLRSFEFPGERLSAQLKAEATPYLLQEKPNYSEDYFNWVWEDAGEMNHSPRPLLAIDLRDAALSESALGSLSEIQTLQTLLLRCSDELSDKALAKVFPLPFLTVLSLGHRGALGPETIKNLVACKDLKALEIECDLLDDGSLDELCALDSLEVLCLDACPDLTDDCIDSLKRLSSLRVLELYRTDLNIEDVRAALPTVQVVED
ncbi:MAG: hypothetical protein P1V97_24790 [Planctomycetota bacterium]|nr:hypothetical protein [Planctomycetota bacterium]